MLKHFVVILRLWRMSILKKRVKALFIVESMLGNQHFPNPFPALSEIAAAVSELQTAALNAMNGGKKAVAVLHQEEAKLVRLLIAIGHYVEGIANKDLQNRESIIISAGMEFKKVHIRKASNFKVKNTEMPGQVKLRTRYLNRVSYIWQQSTNPDDDASWMTVATTLKASLIISNLAVGTRYWFRVAGICQ